MNTMSNRYCVVCSSPLRGKQNKFCCETCKNTYFQSYQSQQNRAIDKRNKLISMLGGKCYVCRYSKSPSTLLFTKEYQIIHLNMREIANHNLLKLQNKLIGAKIICKNCASEIENNDIIQNKILKRFDYNKFLDNLDHFGIKKSDKLVLGVSGGIDSIVMLDLFSQAGFKHVFVAHLNHGVRSEANEDQEFVEDLAKKYGYRFILKTIKPPKKGNLEEKLRKIRRGFLLDVTEKENGRFLALAHNANDQAETVVMNLLRGSGLTGLGGMKMSDEKIIRPVFNFSREEIEDYAKNNKLIWHEDKTNKDISFTRNYLRHQILPLFERINSDWLSNIYKTAFLMRIVDDFMKKEAKKAQDSIHGDVNIMQKLDLPILYEVFAQKYENVAGSREGLSFENIKDLKEFICSSEGTKEIHLPNNVVAKRTYGLLEFFKEKEDNIASDVEKKVKIGITKYNNWTFEATPTKKIQQSKNKSELYLSEGQFKNLGIRSWEKGDFVEKQGISGSKKLQDLFTDAKIDRDKRKLWPIFTDDKGEIIWIPFLAFSRQVNTGSKEIIKITAKKGNNEK